MARQLRKSHILFREADGHVAVELLAPSEDFAELVDPSDGSIRHTGSFAMYGGEWRIESVSLKEELMRIECVSTAVQHLVDSLARERHAPA